MAESLSFAVPQPVTVSAVLRQALLSLEKSPPPGVEGGTMFPDAAWGGTVLTAPTEIAPLGDSCTPTLDLRDGRSRGVSPDCCGRVRSSLPRLGPREST